MYSRDSEDFRDSAFKTGSLAGNRTHHFEDRGAELLSQCKDSFGATPPRLNNRLNQEKKTLLDSFGRRGRSSSFDSEKLRLYPHISFSLFTASRFFPPNSPSFHTCSMFARLSQLNRHLSRPLPNYAHSSAVASRPFFTGSIMTSTSSAEERSKRMIHTAGCIIIGDEVLGGKVRIDEGSLMTFCPAES